MTRGKTPAAMTRDAYAAEILRCLHESGLVVDDESASLRAALLA